MKKETAIAIMFLAIASSVLAENTTAPAVPTAPTPATPEVKAKTETMLATPPLAKPARPGMPVYETMILQGKLNKIDMLHKDRDGKEIKIPRYSLVMNDTAIPVNIPPRRLKKNEPGTNMEGFINKQVKITVKGRTRNVHDKKYISVSELITIEEIADPSPVVTPTSTPPSLPAIPVAPLVKPVTATDKMETKPVAVPVVVPPIQTPAKEPLPTPAVKNAEIPVVPAK